MALEVRMFLGMQIFDFVQIQSNLPKSNHFFPTASILLKFRQNLKTQLIIGIFQLFQGAS